MATQNAVNTTLSGQIGTGAFAGATQPTTFVPTFTFSSPGDVSVVYTIQSGAYVRTGGLVYIAIDMRCTPTYTTSSLEGVIAGLPFPVNSLNSNTLMNIELISSVTWPAGVTQIFATPISTTALEITGFGSGISSANFTTTNFPSGTQIRLTLSGVYAV